MKDCIVASGQGDPVQDGTVRPSVVALLTAAGTGSRMGQEIPKQFLHVEKKPLLVHTMEAFQSHPGVDAILVVTLPDWMEEVKSYATQYHISKLRWVVPGGATGQESIYNGLKAMRVEMPPETIVMIHDGNRCHVSAEIISDSLTTFADHGGAVAAIPCVEAALRSEDGGKSSVVSVPREQLFRTQTPHTYTLEKLLWAYGRAEKEEITGSVATCALMQTLGETVYFSKGSEENLKITTMEDLRIFQALLRLEEEEQTT